MKLQIIILGSSLFIWSCSGSNQEKQKETVTEIKVVDNSEEVIESDRDMEDRIKNTFLNYVYQNHIPFTDGMEVTKENVVLTQQDDHNWKITYHIDLNRTTNIDGESFELNDNLDLEGIISLTEAINDVQSATINGSYEMNNQYVYSFYGPQDNITGGEFNDNLSFDLAGDIKKLSPPIKSSLYQIGIKRLFEEKELRKLSLDELHFLRNEFYARKGYIFKTDKMKNHFNDTEWYKGTIKDPSGLLDDTEKENVFLIKTIEEEKRLVSDNTSNDDLYTKGTKKLLRKRDLKSLSSSQLYFLRNEFYARKGYIFKKETLAEFFGNFDWYSPSSKDVTFSEIEVKNITLISQLEKEKKANNL